MLPELADHYSFLDEEIDVSAMTWEHMFKFMDTHPRNHLTYKSDLGSILLLKCENRKFGLMKLIIDELQKKFVGATITAHVFFGLTTEHSTFGIHRDKMHVLYLQILGTVNWGIFKPKNPDAMADVLKPKDAIEIDNRKLRPGQMVWNPRGTFHHAKPNGTRMGISFGIENYKK